MCEVTPGEQKLHKFLEAEATCQRVRRCVVASPLWTLTKLSGEPASWYRQSLG
jgi:hypothetical protein